MTTKQAYIQENRNVIIELDRTFSGKGEVSKMRFLRLQKSKTAYFYQVGIENCHYEVFLRKTTPVCIDFEKRLYSETEHKEIYPKSKDFGVWAWTYNDFNEALSKFLELNRE